MAPRLLLIVSLFALLALTLPALAQDDAGMAPSVTVQDQFITDQVYIDSVHSNGPGFVVIHIDGGGSPGPVAGFAPVRDGHNAGVWVSVDTSLLTPVLFAMLHTDDGTAGQYEFDGQSGLDNPVSVNGQVVTPSFRVAAIDAAPQFVQNGTVTVGSVTTDTDGWLVIHSDSNGGPGPVLGQTQISAGTTAAVAVSLTGEATATLWPMLHVDTGEVGVYEFGTVEGADGPVRIGNRVAVTPFSTVASIRANPQIIVSGSNAPDMSMAMGSAFRADAALSEGPGWLVIHADNGGSPGPVLGQTALVDGLNEDVDVALSGDITPVVWPMLHVDTGEVGVYEFGAVEGADGPVRVGDQVVTFPVAVAPSITATSSEVTQQNGANVVTVGQIVIDAPGWLVIHADNNGAPGPVLGQAAVSPVYWRNISVPVDAAGVGAQVWPMLHYDTGEMGVYEFGAVEGADGPVRVGDQVVVVPMTIAGAMAPAADATPDMGASTDATEDMGAAMDANACRVAAGGGGSVNIRSDASTDSAPRGSLSGTSSLLVDGQANVAGFTWYHVAEGVEGGGWVRSDVVTATGDCAAVPAMESMAGAMATEAPMAPAAPAEPAATPEAGS